MLNGKERDKDRDHQKQSGKISYKAEDARDDTEFE